jgi:hypothetical protein
MEGFELGEQLECNVRIIQYFLAHAHACSRKLAAKMQEKARMYLISLCNSAGLQLCMQRARLLGMGMGLTGSLVHPFYHALCMKTRTNTGAGIQVPHRGLSDWESYRFHRNLHSANFACIDRGLINTERWVQAMETAIAAVAEFSSNPEERLTNIRKFGAFNQGWFHGIWADDGNAGACCGFQCETCEVNPESKFWCGGIITVRKNHLKGIYTSHLVLQAILFMLSTKDTSHHFY